MRLTPAERETVILFSDESDMATIYTHDKRMKSRLRKLSARHPDLIYRVGSEKNGGENYVVPKICVTIREPYSEERRTMARKHAKTAGYIPPMRGKSK